MFDAEKVTELIAEARNKVTNAEYSRARGIGESTYSLELMVTALADALSSLRDAAEDAEPEWEYATRQGESGWVGTRRVKTGPWLPVPEGNQ